MKLHPQTSSVPFRWARRSAALALFSFAACPSPSLHAASYYVSSLHGSDSNAGTSSTAAWKTLGKVNALNLPAGTKIFLAAGETFSDAGLVFLATDLGSAASPIVVDRFPSTATTLPIIKPPSGQHAINIYNTAGITVQNIELAGSDTMSTYGISMWNDLTTGTKKAGFVFDHVLVHNFFQGIFIGANQASFSGFQDVKISNCTVHDCISDGIVSQGYNYGTTTQQSHKNIQVLKSTVYNCFGDQVSTGIIHSGSGIMISGTLGGTIDGCVAHDNGGKANDHTGGGPVGIWCWNCNGVTIQHSLVYNQKTTSGTTDGGGFDIDGGATNCIVQYCYSYNNQGPGFEVVQFSGAPTITNATVRYNVSWKDGRAGQGSLSVWNGDSAGASKYQNVRFYNNTVVSEGSANPAVGYPIWGYALSAKFYNNIFYALTTSPLVSATQNTGSLTFLGNNYCSAANTPSWVWGSTTYTNFTTWQSAAGTPEKSGGVSIGNYGTPGLSDPVNGASPTNASALTSISAFTPSSATTVINKGQNLTTSTYGSLSVGSVDFLGKPIPVGQYDIGAVEVQTTKK